MMTPRQIQALLNLPTVAAELAAAENAALADRETLVAELHDLEAAHAAELGAATKTADAAHRRVCELTDAHHAANTEMGAANYVVHRLINKHGPARDALTMRLEAGADSRLAPFHAWLVAAESAFRLASWNRVVGATGDGPLLYSDLKARLVSEALQVTAKAIERARAMRFEAVSAADVEAWIATTSAVIAGAAERLGAPLQDFKV